MSIRAAFVALAWLSLAASTAFAQAPASAIRAAVAHVESRVVQLRYFGSDRTLGSAAAPVTGYDLGDGWILTSLYGLRSPPAAVLCVDSSGAQSEATLVGRDHHRQLALLKTADALPDGPRIEGRTARVGETAIALGRSGPSGTSRLTVGIVSAVGRLGGRAVQTDALISPSNYGGPLISLDGALLGVITPLSPPGQAGVNLYDSGIGFAVAPSQIDSRLDRLAAGRDIWPGWLGASFAKQNPLREPAQILEIAEGGRAERAGLKINDVIAAVDETETASLWAMRSVLRGRDAGQSVRLRVTRGEESVSLVVELSRRPDPPKQRPLIELKTQKPDEP